MSTISTYYKGDWVRVEDRSGVVIEGQVDQNLKRYEARTERRLVIRIAQDQTIAIDTSFWKIEILRRNLVPYENSESTKTSQEKHTL